MNVYLKQGQVLKYLTYALALVGALYAVYGLSSERVGAAEPYTIMYSYNSDFSNAQPLDGATITQDMYVFILDDDPQDSTHVGFAKGGWWTDLDSSRDWTHKTFDHEVVYQDAGGAGQQVYRVRAYNNGVLVGPELWAEYTIPYRQTFYGRNYSGFDITAFASHSNAFRLGGTVGSGAGKDWKIQGEFKRGGTVFTQTEDIGDQDELRDMVEADVHDQLFAVGSYVSSGIVRPVIKGYHFGTLALRGGLNGNVWGANVPGSVNAIVTGLHNLNDPVSSNPQERIWFAGYTGGGVSGPAYWEIGKAIVNDNWLAPSDIIDGTGNWGLQATSSATYGGGAIAGEAMAMTKDLGYIYTGGYVEIGGDPYWRIEKRDRSSGLLIDDIEFTGATHPAVKGKILAMDVQIIQGTHAVWAAGYEDVAGVLQWRFQKFTFDNASDDGNFVPGVTGPPAGQSQIGQIKEISIHGIDNVYFGGEAGGTVNSKWLIQRYSRDGVYKDYLLDEDISGGNDKFGAMILPIVVGTDSGGSGFLRGVKAESGTISCEDALPASTKPERIIIDHTGRGGFASSNNDDTTVTVSNPIAITQGVDFPTSQNPNIPAGKYEVFQVSADGGHQYHIDHFEQTQDHEQIVSYFFGANSTDFAKTAPSPDIPSDWMYQTSTQPDVTIPFDVVSLTSTNFIYDQDDGGSTAANWDKKGIINYSPANWRHGGSVGAVCTALDRYPECSDGVDNDGDLVIDSDDPQCHTDGDPLNPATYDKDWDDESGGGLPQCSDGIDNDGDSLADSADPGCHTDEDPLNPATYDPTDDDETNLPNLGPPSIGGIIPSPGPYGFSLITGFYNDVRLPYSINNIGSGDAWNFDNEFVSNFGGGAPASLSNTVTSHTDVLFGHDSTPTKRKVLATDVTPGNYSVNIKADYEDDVVESNETDNISTLNGFLPAPDPGIRLDINPGFVRIDETAELSWNTNATYSMSCEVVGQGTVIDSFNPKDAGPTGVALTGPISAKSEFTLRCQELISGRGDFFSTTAIVETVGEVEER